MKIILHKNPALVIFVRLGMALVLAVGVLAGAPAILVRAAGCVVSSTLDDGSAGTLRAAIDDVSCDTITFDAGLAGATITLASTLTLAHDVSIDGSALATQVRISGGHRYEVLYVNSDVAADLKGLIIFNGYNLVSKRGGGIYNAGKLTMTNSTVAGSHAGGKNDNPVRAGSNNPDAYGGGIYNDGVLTVMDSTFSENNASYCGDAYGGAIYNASVLSVTDSTFFGNFIQECGTNNGGAIANAGVLTVMGSTFSGNITDGGWFEGVSYGGGIYNTGTSTVAKSIFVDNTAAVIWNEGFGAGIYSTGVMTVTDSSFSGNHADNSGGGIENNGKLEVANSTFSGNSAGPMFPVRGGGIENRGTLTVMNSTFSDNNTGDNWSDGTAGGGIDNSGNLTLLNSTFSGNSAGNYSKAVGGGIDNSGAMDFANIIIANSTGLHGLDCLSTGTIGANTNNLVRDGSCSQGGVNFKKGDPKLGKLADNGGPTQTLALLPGSPAINAGDDATCAAAPVNNLDQRGVTRPSSLHCDIGAYELVQVPKERARNGGFNT